MTSTLSPAETCRKVADIIDLEPERFYMGNWQLDFDCGTTACIAGLTGALYNDPVCSDRQFRYYGAPSQEWKDRQATRLGLTSDAGEEMFYAGLPMWSKFNTEEDNIRYSEVLRHLEKELRCDSREGLISKPELRQIADKALAKN